MNFSMNKKNLRRNNFTKQSRKAVFDIFLHRVLHDVHEC